MRKIILSTIIVFSLISCRKDKEPHTGTQSRVLRVDVQPLFGVDTLYLDSVYQTQEGYKIKFTEIKFFLEDIRNGDHVLKDAALFDYRENGTFLLSNEGDKSNFSQFTANLGVQQTLNHQDPSTFPTESVLNILNCDDMHWNWNPGYIFLKIEAKADTILDNVDNLNHNIVFHIGKDENLQTIALSSLDWQSNGNEDRLTLKVDLKSFLEQPQPIDVRTEYSSHSAPGQETLSLKVISNFKDAISVN